jgi:hypothetical protein
MPTLQEFDRAIASQKRFIDETRQKMELAVSAGRLDDGAAFRRDLGEARRTLARIEEERASNTPRVASSGGGFVGSNF